MPLQKIIPLIWISALMLTGCSHVAGNIIPEGGPTMESIYDGVSDGTDQEELSVVTQKNNMPPIETIKLNSASPLEASIKPVQFAQLENPELKLYVFPHLAGSELLPIPGYWTAFSAYPRTYYALPLSIKEGS